MSKILDPKIVLDKIEIAINTNDVEGAKAITDAWGPTIPVIKINDYVVSLGDILSYNIEVRMNKIPTFSIEIIDSKFLIRKALNKEKIDTCVIFIGNKIWYHKYNGLITNCISDAGDENIIITGIIFNPKLYNTYQKPYNNLSALDIITDICTTTDMGLFIFDNKTLTNVLLNCLCPGMRYIEFFVDTLTKYTNNLWCFDTFYFMHVGDISTIRNKPIDTYTIRNGKKFDSPQPIVISTNPNYDIVDYNLNDSENDFKLKASYYTVNTNIGESHIKHYDTYNINGSDSKIVELLGSNGINGIGNKNENTFSRFVDTKFPFYQSRVNKEISGKSITIEMSDILYEIIPFQLIDLELFFPTDKDSKTNPNSINSNIKDPENSGKKVIIGYNLSYNKADSENNYPVIKQSIEVI